MTFRRHLLSSLTSAVGLALVVDATVESPCDCNSDEYYDYSTRACIYTSGSMSSYKFLFDYFEYKNCPSKPYWELGHTYALSTSESTNRCMCVNSGTYNLDSGSDDPLYSWDNDALVCSNSTTTTTKTTSRDIELCARELVYGFPGAYSNCGSMNMCTCFLGHYYTSAAIKAEPNALYYGNALNMMSQSVPSKTLCGWDFNQNMCVPQTGRFDARFDSFPKTIKARKMCQERGYYSYPNEYSPSIPTYTYVLPTENQVMCAGLTSCNCYEEGNCKVDASQSCYEDGKCVVDNGKTCVPSTNSSGAEEPRTPEVVLAESIANKCGDSFCSQSKYSTPCACYETPHSEGVCGWDNVGSACKAKTVTNIKDMYEAHCCDAFKDPCECKFGRLPWTGVADFDNTCGWDSTIDTCVMSAVTTPNDLSQSECVDDDGCIFADSENDCDNIKGDCTFHEKRQTCYPSEYNK